MARILVADRPAGRRGSARGRDRGPGAGCLRVLIGALAELIRLELPDTHGAVAARHRRCHGGFCERQFVKPTGYFVAACRLDALRAQLAAWPQTWGRVKAGVEALLRFHQRRLPQERRRFLEWWQRWRQAGADEVVAGTR